MEKNSKYLFDNVNPISIFSNEKPNIELKNEKEIIEANSMNKILNVAKKRFIFLFLLVIFFYGFISFSLFEISMNQISESNNEKAVTKTKNRGIIFDREKNIISATIPTFDLYLDTSKIINFEKTKSEILKIFPSKKKFFEKYLSEKKYILVSKHLTSDQKFQINKIGEPAFKFHKSTKRVYPQNNLFSHVTGFMSKFGTAQSKLEKSFNTKLNNGEDLQLTLDLKIQNIVYEELKAAKEIFNAKSALSLILDVNNGEILSMVSLPDFNPNHPSQIKPFTENNLITNARYEMGSTIKMFNAALIFENDMITNNEVFKIPKCYNVTKTKSICDETKFEKSITFDEIFIHSSNVGSILLLEKSSLSQQQNFLKKIGFESKLNLNGLNVLDNNLPGSKEWNEVLSKSISIGYGISITPLSLANSFATLVNGGFKINPTIIKGDSNLNERILKADTSKKINQLLTKIIEDGTGKKAKVQGINVGGKTGTAKKIRNNKGYFENKNITSFIGTFPIEKPEYLVFVLFDEPKDLKNKKKKFTGGSTAAPLFSKIVNRIVPVLKKNSIKDNKLQENEAFRNIK